MSFQCHHARPELSLVHCNKHCGPTGHQFRVTIIVGGIHETAISNFTKVLLSTVLNFFCTYLKLTLLSIFLSSF